MGIAPFESATRLNVNPASAPLAAPGQRFIICVCINMLVYKVPKELLSFVPLSGLSPLQTPGRTLHTKHERTLPRNAPETDVAIK